MKKYIKQIAVLVLMTTFTSCSSDDNLDLASVGGNVVPAVTSISRLDNNYNIPLGLITKQNVTVTKVEILKDGQKISDAVISGDEATFNTSTLGSFDVFPNSSGELIDKTGTFDLTIVSTYSDGSTTVAPYTLTVAKGIVWKVLNANGALATSITSGVTTVNYNDPTPVKIHYAVVNKASTVIDAVVGEWSKNGGAFSPLTLSVPYSKTNQTIDIANIPYSTYSGLNANDEITYRFTVTAGTQTDVITSKVKFANQVFGSANNGSITNVATQNKFSFLTGKNYDSLDTKNGEISFSPGFGIKGEGATGIQFVKTTSLDYNTADLFQASNVYTTGTKTTSLNALNTGDIAVYTITRKVDFGTEEEPDVQDVTYYGILKITDKIQGSTSETLQFSYKEGELKI